MHTEPHSGQEFFSRLPVPLWCCVNLGSTTAPRPSSSPGVGLASSTQTCKLAPGRADESEHARSYQGWCFPPARPHSHFGHKSRSPGPGGPPGFACCPASPRVHLLGRDRGCHRESEFPTYTLVPIGMSAHAGPWGQGAQIQGGTRASLDSGGRRDHPPQAAGHPSTRISPSLPQTISATDNLGRVGTTHRQDRHCLLSPLEASGKLASALSAEALRLNKT